MAKLKDLKVTIGLSKKGLTKLNADLRRTKSNFRRNFGEISDLAGRAGAAIVGGLVAGMTAVIKAGADMQRVEVGFRSIMGSAEGASQMVDQLNKFTASTPYRLEEVARSARQLIAVGTGVDDVNDRLKMLGDIAAASGNSISDIAAAFAKVQAKGKVDLENLNQLAERGIPIFDELRKVTGDANMEFGAGSVSVEEYNQALANMAAEGGFANDAMANLSETVSGKFSTAMDNLMLAMGDFAEKTGLLASVTQVLDDTTIMLNRFSTNNDDVNASLEKSKELADKVAKAHKGNAEALSIEADEAKTAAEVLNNMLGTEESALALAKATEVATSAWNTYMDSLTAGSTLSDAPVPTSEDAGPTLAEFTAQFEAAAALTAERLRLAEATRQNIVNDQALAEAQQALTDAYGGFSGVLEEVAIEEEELFDEDSQQRVTDMTRRLKIAGMAAANLGGAFNLTSQLTEAAFANIKDKSQGFHQVIKDMLESLLKKAIALAAAFAAMSIFTGGGAAAAAKMGGFKEFMLGGLGVHGFAAGGLVTGPTMAMVGEGVGTTLSNPEVIAPLDKLQQMMGGGGNVTVTGMIRGSDILLSNERSLLDRNRVRGF